MTPEISKSSQGFDPAVKKATRVKRRSGTAGGQVSGLAVLPLWAWFGFAILVAWGSFTANPLITVGSILVLPMLVALLWRPGEPPVLLFAGFMQWTQAAFGIYIDNGNGLTLAQDFGGPQLEEATWLSLLGILVLALGMHLILSSARKIDMAAVYREAQVLSLPRVFGFYLIAYFIANFLRRVAFIIPPLQQTLSVLSLLSWVPIVFLTFAVMAKRRGYGLLACVVFFEFASGFLGFFSGFKSVFYILAILILSWSGKLPVRRLILAAVIGVFLIVVGSFWCGVKSEYRTFVSQGSSEQSNKESASSSLGKLLELAEAMDFDKFSEGYNSMLGRITYVDYFAHTIAFVPDNVPYQYGKLWLEAVTRVFMPRLLFPNKEAVDDSSRTQAYTGLDVAGAEEGGSIGLGYIAESYVDFGPCLMFAPIFLLGMFYGMIFRILACQSNNRLLGISCATIMIVFGAFGIETSNVNEVGGNLMNLLVFGFINWRCGPYVSRMLKA